ncbi:hypothetical protein KAR91_32695 [Candidatus Pacearchaeota archaeon]|nr:hypothetical protein [Candidatus Pacearchaeota archaeon]
MPEEKLPIDEKVLDRIGVQLRKDFDEAESLRALYREDEWLESTRQLKGIYDPEVLQKIQPGKSQVYPRYTRSKVQPAVAKLNDMLFPDNDKNFEIKTTPEPKVSQEDIDALVDLIEPFNEEGNPREVSEEEIDAAVMAYAQQSVDKMNVTMDDQLEESRYRTKAKAVVRSSVILGTGIFKGPLSKSETKRKMVKKEAGYVQEENKEFRPFVDSVSLWRWFPDMSSTELDHCNFACELHSMTKHELRKLSKRKNFKADVMREYVRTHKEGDYKLRQWEIDLKTIKEEESVKASSKNYEVIEYNGYLDGHDLFKIGVLKEGDDIEKDWFVSVWLLGNKVIKAIKHPIESLTELYHIFYFEKDDSSIFGEGLPRVIRDTQISICSATRAMLDNAAWLAGPILELNSDLMEDEDLDDIYPGRTFEREGRGVDAQYPAIRVYNVDSRLQDYLAIIGKFEQNGDMESTMPAFLFGAAAKTTNETAKGISIRSSNTNLTINDIVKNFDEANESLLRAWYQWNMKYNKDKSIKGDMQVKAVGSSSLVSKEVRTQNLDLFAQGLSPEDRPYVKSYALLEERIKMHDLPADKILHTEEEGKANIENAKDQEIAQLQKDAMQADIRYDNAKALNMESKSEATIKGISTAEVESLMSILEKLKGGQGGGAIKKESVSAES